MRTKKLQRYDIAVFCDGELRYNWWTETFGRRDARRAARGRARDAFRNQRRVRFVITEARS